MKTLSLTTPSRPATCRGGSCTAIPTRTAGFTLVEMLVVIGIIAVLVSLTVPAVIHAMHVAKVGAIRTDISQLEMSFGNYRTKFGEFPPDFAGLQNPHTDPMTGVTYNIEAQNLVLRHFSRMYPRYIPGVPTGTTPTGTWAALQADVLAGWGININNLTPAAATVFFLGGKPDWFLDSAATPQPILPGSGLFDASKPIKGLLGFSANQTNPFDNSAGRVHPFYDFDINSIGWLNGGLAYWPKTQAVSDKTTGPIVYFRAENTNYTINGYALNQTPGAPLPPPPTSAVHIVATNVKCDPATGVYAAVDTRYSNFSEIGSNYLPGRGPVYKWVNDQSFQLFTSGQNQNYTAPQVPAGPIDCLTFPSGESYSGATYDDITNFTDGTLESALK
jgi:prepilin-type N-terminal cleavage/methylation domain-containing protein